MRDEFSKHRCLGQECRRLSEAAEKTVIRSFLCLWFVVSQSVMLVELLFLHGVECVVVWRGCVVVYVCLCTCWFDKKIIFPRCLPFLLRIIIINIILIRRRVCKLHCSQFIMFKQVQSQHNTLDTVSFCKKQSLH